MPQPALLIVCAEKRTLLKIMATNDKLITRVLDNTAQVLGQTTCSCNVALSSLRNWGHREFRRAMEKVEDAEADWPGTTVTLGRPTAAGSAMGKLFDQQLAYLGACGSLESRLGDVDLWDPVEGATYKAHIVAFINCLTSCGNKILVASHLPRGQHLALLPANFAWTWPWTIMEMCTPFGFGVGDIVVIKCNMKMWYKKCRGAGLETNQVIRLEAAHMTVIED
ncbi:hypothetical protein C8J57DRAFT_1491403 [Mycena rebaudengoi]|nr:hypothetical protein C8J57DRAFT_1491403 [Mycena rebaudengoi]